jgi:hypothetical protein
MSVDGALSQNKTKNADLENVVSNCEYNSPMKKNGNSFTDRKRMS